MSEQQPQRNVEFNDQLQAINTKEYQTQTENAKAAYKAAFDRLQKISTQAHNPFAKLAEELVTEIDEQRKEAKKNLSKAHIFKINFNIKLYTQILSQTADVIEDTHKGKVFTDYIDLIASLEKTNSAQKVSGIMHKVAALALFCLGAAFSTATLITGMLLNPLIALGAYFVSGFILMNTGYVSIPMYDKGHTLFASAKRFQNKILTPMQKIKQEIEHPPQKQTNGVPLKR